MKVLLVSFEFWPSASTAARRASGLAKYLQRLGCSVVVVAAKTTLQAAHSNGCYGLVYYTPWWDIMGTLARWKRRCQQLYRRKNAHGRTPGVVHASGQSVRATHHLRALVTFPDYWNGWLPFVVPTIRRCIHRFQPDIVWSTAHPITAHVAVRLALPKGLPWVADFRDLWALSPVMHDLWLSWQRHWQQRLEQRLAQRMNAITTVSEPFAQVLAQTYQKPARVILNGFDPEEFDFIQTERVQVTSDFRIVYAGTIGHQGRCKAFRMFLDGLVRFHQEVQPRSALRIDMYGVVGSALPVDLRTHPGMAYVQCHGMISRVQVLRKIAQAPILLLLNWVGAYAKGAYSGKIFEYLAVRRPILAVGTRPTVMEELLRRTDSGWYCANSEEVARVLHLLWNQYTRLGHIPSRGNVSIVQQYTHHEMARAFLELFQEIRDQA